VTRDDVNDDDDDDDNNNKNNNNGGKIEGRIEVMGRRGRRRQKLLDDLEEKRGYWKLKEEAVDHTVWRIGFVRGLDLSLSKKQ
jgi:hypothetical protein